ncbi:SLC13 family permease [Yoonia sp. I 8.24]|uniref:SLC13 family permease n=1 Tax=Yoonia sp. I 8.24 TaxID=1537229 RepID=UPI001EDD710E|nr:anion permease [Yoonia sp. I 8.24]
MSDTNHSLGMQSTSYAFRDFVAWSLVGLLPWLLYLQLAHVLPLHQTEFLCFALAAIVMWIFRLTPDFVPGLALLLIVVLLGIVPREIAFSGFYSQVFFLIFGIFVLAALLAETSWLNKLEAVLVRKNASFPTRLLAVVASGVLLTLVVPSPLGRASMVQPLVHRFFRANRAGNNSFLALAHIHGATLLSTIILTGNPLNFVLLGMLDDQTSNRYQWLGWLQAASVAGLVIAVGFAAALFVFAVKRGAGTGAQAADAAIDVQANPMRDWATLGLYAFLLVAILTRPIHQVPLEWIVLSLAMAVFFFSGLTLANLRSRFDWPTLIFVATVVAWGPMLDHLGLSQWLADQMPILVPIFERNLYLGFAITMAGVFVIRLAVPGAPAFIILASALLPFAETIGISPWVLGFTILTVSEGFIWPYQHGVFSQNVTTLDAERTAYRMSSLIIFNIFFYLLRCGAVFLSIPFWKALNLI